MAIILPNLNRFSNFFTGRFLGKVAVRCSSKKSVLMNINLAKLQARTLLSCALSSSFSSVLASRTRCIRQARSCLKLCQIFTDLKKITDRLSNKPFLIWLLTTPPHLKYVATLPCNLSLIACFQTLMFHKVV